MPMQTLEAGLAGTPSGGLGLDKVAELGRRATAGENWDLRARCCAKLPGNPGI